MNLPAPVLVTAGAVGAAYLGVGIAAARYAILGRQRRLRIIGRPSPTTIRLPRINPTESPVRFGLQDESGRLIVVDTIVHFGEEFIDRRIEAESPLEAGQRVQLIGNVFGPDSELVRSAVAVSTKDGAIVHQVWDVDPPGAKQVLRFVHIHGLGAAPATTLRSVDAATRLGYASTIVSLDGNPDMTRRVDGIRSTAAARVQWAIDHARSLGAERVVLVGWSFGAQLASEATSHRTDVAGLLLISPTVDLLDTIAAEAAARRIPSVVANAAKLVLTTPLLSRFARVDRPFPRRPVAHANDLPPTLWIRSGRDETLTAVHPTGATEWAPGSLRTVEFASAPHTMEWNTDPELFAESIDAWCNDSIGATDATG